MNTSKGFIYLRDNIWYQRENVIKMGITTFAKDRNNTYITGEIERGEYICLIEIPLDRMKILDKYLKVFCKSYNIYKGGGTEFYDRCVIELIEPYLNDINIDFKVLTKDEISSINRCDRIRNLPNAEKVKKLLNQINVKNIIMHLKNKKAKIKSTKVIPNNHQQDVLNMIDEFFQLNSIGKIIWACGLGKALLSIFIVNQLKCKTVAFGVPGKFLQKQIKNEIYKLFPNAKNILFVGGEGIDDIEATTDKNKIVEFLNNADKYMQPKFVITTYHSCHLLCDTNIMFDIKIGDEAHHLVGLEREESKGFRIFHKINSNKSLFMTATEKVFEDNTNKETLYSMDDESIFGKYIDMKSVHWAIENEKITDYNILVLKNTECEVKNIINSLNNLNLHNLNDELFISCYMTLKSMDKYKDLTHILLYTTTIDDADKASKYIEVILSTNIISIPKEQIYYSSIHSRSNNDFDDEVSKFKNSRFGIITCVNCFGEGVDIPILNGVCVASNMYSEIRIVQYLLRPNRLDKENLNKKAYIIIPYIEGLENNWDNNKNSYANVRTIISHLRNVDKNVEQKIFVQTVNKQFIKYRENMLYDKQLYYEDYVFKGNVEELNNLKIKLRYSKTLCSDFTEEQDEYNYIRSLNKSLNLDSKEEYAKCKDRHPNFIDNAEVYFKYRGVWNDWYDFLGTDTSKFIQSKDKWKEFCKNKNIKSYEEYIINCDIYNELPKNPCDFYRNFTNFPNELEGYSSRRR
jgi:superfamily II DNA or RNA helicase